jgi:hypothetical protein
MTDPRKPAADLEARVTALEEILAALLASPVMEEEQGDQARTMHEEFLSRVRSRRGPRIGGSNT